jgi:hypothetical protein
MKEFLRSVLFLSIWLLIAVGGSAALLEDTSHFRVIIWRCFFWLENGRLSPVFKLRLPKVGQQQTYAALYPTSGSSLFSRVTICRQKVVWLSRKACTIWICPSMACTLPSHMKLMFYRFRDAALCFCRISKVSVSSLRDICSIAGSLTHTRASS